MGLSDPAFPLYSIIYPTISGLSCVPAFWLLRSRRITLANHVLVISNFVAIAGAYLTVGGFRGPATILLLWPIVVASMLLGSRAGLVTAAIAAIFHGGMAAMELAGRFTPLVPSAAPASTYVSIGSGIFMFLLVAFLSCLSTASLKIALQKARQRAVELDIRLGENERLVNQLWNTAEQLTPMAEELAVAMEQMNAAAEQIAATASQMSQGATSQAHRTEEAARSTAQLAFATDQIAGNARQANDASAQAQKSVQDSARVVSALGNKLGEIERVVALVEKIADQTNLLALNASIEAARAGEHGAGFAVVADEVRRLAEHSAASVGEIAALSQGIGDILHEVLAAMGEAQIGTAHTLVLTRDVDAMAQEQDRASEAMGRAVNEIAAVAEGNASASEQIAASIEEQSASIGQVASSAQALADLADSLQRKGDQR